MGKTLTKRPISDLLLLQKDPVAFFLNAKQYGDIVQVPAGLRHHFYVLNDPELIKDVLLTKNTFFKKGRAFEVLKKVVGEGLLTANGEKHRRQRTLLQPHFLPQQLAGYAEEIVSRVQKKMSVWQDGEQRMITDEMIWLTLAIITELMFGEPIQEGYPELEQAVEMSAENVVRRSLAPFNIPLAVPTRRNQAFKRAIRQVDEIIYGIIEERRKRLVGSPDDLLSMSLTVRDEQGNGLSDEEVRSQATTIFMAGHETSAYALSWTWYLLAGHPQVEEKFWGELDTVPAGRVPTFADLPNLTYTHLILLESLRLYPPVWLLNRDVLADVEIGGHRLAKGDSVWFSQYVMQRSPEHFEQPDVFMPERFAGDLLKRIPQFAYFPFGGGPRLCVGNHFAMTEMVLVLATIGQKYQLQMAAGHPPVEPLGLLSLKPKDGLRMRIVKR